MDKDKKKRLKTAFAFIIIGALMFLLGHFNFSDDSVHNIMCKIFGVIIFALGFTYLISERIFDTIKSLVHESNIFNICCFMPLLALYVYVLINYFINKNDINDFFEITSTIKDEASLEDALHNSSKIYIIDSLLVSGKPITEYNDLFSSEILSLKSSTAEYKEIKRSQHEIERHPFDTYKKEWSNISSETYISDSTLLCDKYKFNLNQLDLRTSLPANVNDVLKKYRSNFVENYYYPNKPGDFVGNTRQIFDYIKNNTGISFVAEIGNDSIKIIEICHNKFVTQGGQKNLREKYIGDENDSIFVFSILFFLGSVFFFLSHDSFW